MLTGVILVALGVLGLAVAALVWRSDPDRLDNRMFALLAAADSARSAWLGGVVLDGNSLGSEATLIPGVIGAIVVAYLSIEFVYSFPFERRAPAWMRWPLFVMMLVGLVLVLHPTTRATCHTWLTFGYFLPVFALALGLLWKNYRRLVGDRVGITIIMLAIAIRWS